MNASVASSPYRNWKSVAMDVTNLAIVKDSPFITQVDNASSLRLPASGVIFKLKLWTHLVVALVLSLAPLPPPQIAASGLFSRALCRKLPLPFAQLFLRPIPLPVIRTSSGPSTPAPSSRFPHTPQPASASPRFHGGRGPPATTCSPGPWRSLSRWTPPCRFRFPLTRTWQDSM